MLQRLFGIPSLNKPTVSDSHQNMLFFMDLNISLSLEWKCVLQVNLFQKLLCLHQLTHNMRTDCSLNYKFNSWKFQAQTWGEHVAYRNCFWHSEQFLYATCSPHALQKEEVLTKIYLYHEVKFWGRCMW